ncbi:MAG: glycerate kinase [Candidatus Nanopelagicales bacterium]
MRVLVCTDSFGDTMSAAVASEIIANQVSLEFNVETDFVGLSDGGPGFLECISTVLPGTRHVIPVSSHTGEAIPASWYESNAIAYIESAEICGLHLANELNPLTATTYGVGQMVKHIIEAGITHIRVGLGGVATNDAGAGMLAALGASSVPSGLLQNGGIALASLESVDITGARDLMRNVILEAMSDVDNPLLGNRGASRTYAGQKGATETQVEHLETALSHFSNLIGVDMLGKNPRVALGAGAAGGLGYGLLLLGARRTSGFSFIAEIQDVERKIEEADLLITGEGKFDWKTLDGKVVSGLSSLALKYGKPLVVIAGQVEIGRRDWQTIGVNAAFAMSDDAPLEVCKSRPEEILRKTSSRMGRTWLR